MKKFLLIVLTVVLLLLISGAVLHKGRQPDPFPINSQSAAMLQPGPLEVLKHPATFIDDSRPTEPNGDYEGDPTRRPKRRGRA